MINKLLVLVLFLAGCTYIAIDGEGNSVETGQVFDKKSDIAIKPNGTNTE